MAKIFYLLLVGVGLLLTSIHAWAQDADPTRPVVRHQPLSSQAVDISGYRLTSVWYRGANAQGTSSAVINGERVELGDTVGAYVVEAIEPGQVLLNNDDGQMWLQVFRSNNLTIEPSRG